MKRLLLYLFILPGVLLSSCLKDEYEELEKEELAELKEYLEENGITEEASLNSVYYIYEKYGNGVFPESGEYVRINYEHRLLDGTLVVTNDSSLIDWNSTDSTIYEDFIFIPLKIVCDQFRMAGLNIGIKNISEGGKAKLIIPSKLGFYDFETRIFTVEIVEVIPDIVDYEKENLALYLDRNSITVDSTESGLYYIEEEKYGMDESTIVEEGDSLLVKYTGFFLEMDAQPVQFETTGNDTVLWTYFSADYIEGFAEGLSYMHPGTKAKIIIPYYLGYDDEILYHSSGYFTLIPAYSTLIFDIELIHIGKSSP